MVKGKLKKTQELPQSNALEIIQLFIEAGFEVVVDNGDLVILKFLEN